MLHNNLLNTVEIISPLYRFNNWFSEIRSLGARPKDKLKDSGPKAEVVARGDAEPLLVSGKFCYLPPRICEGKSGEAMNPEEDSSPKNLNTKRGASRRNQSGGKPEP